MYKRAILALAIVNVILAGSIAVQPAAAEGFWPTCCKSDVGGNGFCASCWFTHDCHATKDCGTIIVT
jgi:hypothetical protein